MLNVEITLLPQLLDLIEFRSISASDHNQRMSKYVRTLLQNALDKGLYPDVLTDEYVELSSKYVIFHDIGKIIIPDSILTATRRLTDAEFELIKRHSETGANILERILSSETAEARQIAKDIAMSHHEKWDGTGNPLRKKELQIPLCARATAIADVYDALTTPRCYRERISTSEAMDIIRQDAGTHFDPNLVDVFI